MQSVVRMTMSERNEALTREQERELTERLRNGCPTALHELVVKHRPLVAAMAKRYGRPGAPREDLLHEGFVGLLDAAGRFDPDRGTRFSTYARWWVRYYMQRYVRANRRMVTPSKTRNMRKLRQRLRKTARELEQRRGGAVSAEDLAKVLEVSVNEVLEVQQELSYPDMPISVDDPRAGHDPIAHDGTPEEEAATVERRRVARELAERALSVLDPRERKNRARACALRGAPVVARESARASRCRASGSGRSRPPRCARCARRSSRPPPTRPRSPAPAKRSPPERRPRAPGGGREGTVVSGRAR